MAIKVHPTAEVQSDNIGDGTLIWQYSVILKNAIIGKNCNINFNVFIENDVIIGDNVTIKSGVQIWDGLLIGNNAFIGPNVTFTNDLIPRSKQYPESFAQTIIDEGASIGANATVISGIRIGKYAMIGAGSVVTKDVPEFTLWYGNPAKHQGYATRDGRILSLELIDKEMKKYTLINSEPQCND
ncbi:MAG: acyltransferase [Bacteroidales bacterium]|nr:acyltransferase [Bacteroidales bacterium]